MQLLSYLSPFRMWSATLQTQRLRTLLGTCTKCDMFWYRSGATICSVHYLGAHSQSQCSSDI